MTSYTPEQIRQCISWLAGNFRVTADGKYRECADILAATLKAAQGGVKEAINWSEFWNRISQNFDSADVDKVRACYKAALSAQQGRGEAVAEVGDVARYINTGSPRWDSAAFKAWKEGNQPGSHNWMKRIRELLAASPAPSPAERVPEGFVVERVNHGRGDERYVGTPDGSGTTVSATGPLDSRILFYLADALLASPAPSPARGDGECGFCGRPGKHKIGESCLTKSATFQLNAGEP